MTDEVGLRINGVLYPPPAGYTLGEARTIKRMTGLELPAFAKELERLTEDSDEPRMNADVFAAYVWVSMHRVNPSVKPEDVDNLDFGDIETEGPKNPPAEAGETPASDSSSQPPAPQPNGSQDTSSDPTPVFSGSPRSELTTT